MLTDDNQTGYVGELQHHINSMTSVWKDRPCSSLHDTIRVYRACRVGGGSLSSVCQRASTKPHQSRPHSDPQTTTPSVPRLPPVLSSFHSTPSTTESQRDLMRRHLAGQHNNIRHAINPLSPTFATWVQLSCARPG